MAATGEMAAIALRHKPHAACIVPERREERTTEGGLDVASGHHDIAPIVAALTDAGVRVSLFVEPEQRQLEAAAKMDAPVVELHTGKYCEAFLHGSALLEAERERIEKAAKAGVSMGLEVHAGHGLAFDTVGPIAQIAQIAELNIGHFLVGEAIFVGLEASIRSMRQRMDVARGVIEVGVVE